MKKLYPIYSILMLFIVPALSSAQSVQVDWMAGWKTNNHNSTTAAPAKPATLEHSMGWYDNNGNIWLFGGSGPSHADGNSSELWKYNIGTNTWSKIGAGNLDGVKDDPVYGSNNPGSRSYSTWWQSGNYFYFFGGGNGNSGGGSNPNPFINEVYSDLWRFDPIANAGNGQWAYIRGPQSSVAASTIFFNGAPHNGVYGTLQTPNASNNPPARQKALKWVDNNGDLWMYGGFTARPEEFGYTDMWKYDVSADRWIWMNGPQGISTLSPVTTGVNAHPGVRGEGLNWTDADGNLWLYGGFIQNGPSYADLWRYDVTLNQWFLVDNNPINDFGNPASVIGTEYPISDNSNQPRARYSSWNWVQDGYLYLMYSASRTSAKDIWRFNPYCLSWTRVANYTSTTGTIVDNAGAGLDVLQESHGGWNVQVNDTTIFVYQGFTGVGSGHLGDLSRVIIPSSLNPILTTTSVSAVPSSICNGSSTTLTAVGCGNGTSVRWYTDASFSTLVSSSNPVVVSPSSTTTYYPGCYNASTGCVVNIAAHSVIVNVSNPPSAPTGVSASPTTGCTPSYVTTLSGTCGSGVIRWYTSAGATGAGVGTTPTVTANTTYYAKCFVSGNPSGCQYSAASAGVPVTISSAPAAPTGVSASPTTGCSPSYVTTLSGSCGSGVIRWYTSAGATGAGVGTTPTVTANTTYYAKCFVSGNPSGCQYSAASAGVPVTISSPPAAPTGVSASPTTGCSPSYVTALSGSCGSGVIRWYTSAGATGAGVGTTPTVTANTTYYAKCFVSGNPSGCQYSAASAGVPVTISSPPSAPTGVSASPTTGCSPSYVTTLSGTCGSGVIRWYTSAGATGAGVGTTPTVTANTTYYAKCFVSGNPSGCQYSAASAGVSVTITSAPSIPTSVNASPNSGCGPYYNTFLTGSCATGIIRWYGSSTATGPDIGNFISVTRDSIVYARCYNAGNPAGCRYSNPVSVNLTLIPLPSAPIAGTTTTPICNGTSTTLTSSGCSGGTVTWYTDSNRGTSVSSTTVSPSTTTTYYAFCTVNGCISSSWDSVRVDVNSVPSAPTSAVASPNSICLNDSSTLSASGCLGGIISWYTNSSGTGTQLSSLRVSPPSNTTYYAFCSLSGCRSNTSATVTLTVNPTPPNPTVLVNSDTICEYDSTDLVGSCSSGTIQWFLDSNQITPINSRVSPAANTTYYAFCFSSPCYSNGWDSVGVVVNQRPLRPSSASLSKDTICLSENSDLSAGGCSGGTIQWYLDSLATGLPLSSTTVSPSSNTTYYAFCNMNGCLSIGWDSVTLYVGDNRPPELNCPSNINDTLVGDCDFTLPDYTSMMNVVDSCSGTNVTVIQSPTPGTVIDFRTQSVQTIQIIATDPSNNSDTCYFDITIFCAPDIRIPEFISPNGDGQNDTWRITGLEFYPENNVKIFNRWGALLYDKNGYDNDWEGQVNTDFLPTLVNDRNQVPSGTYFYLLDLYGDGKEVYTGYVQLRK